MPKSPLLAFVIKELEYLFAGGTLSGIPEYVSTHFTWHRFAAIQIWIFVLFLIYTSVEELNARLADDELRKIFFTGRSSKMTPTTGTAQRTRRSSMGPQEEEQQR